MDTHEALMGLKTIRKYLNLASDTHLVLAKGKGVFVVYEEDWVEEFGFQFESTDEYDALQYFLDEAASLAREYDERWKAKYGHFDIRKLLGYQSS